jgi:glycosyltransferase involved in cell wall biosynthesis
VRVCFLIDELATAGTETQLLALIRHLDRQRVQPYLALLRGEAPSSRALEPNDCPVLRLGVGALRSPSTLLKASRFVNFLRRERIDVLQAYFPDSSYFGLPLARLAGTTHRLRTRNNIGHEMTPLRRFLGRALNRFTTASIANCAAARDALLADERPRPGSVFVLENGVDLDRFTALPAPAARTPTAPACVGAVANLRPVKGLDVFVSAAALLASAHPAVTFRVGGEGEHRAALERQITEKRLTGRFVLPGAARDVPAFLGALDLAVLPSRAEGMSNALLEYMAAGRPIVATAVGGTPDLLADGQHGLLVPPADAARLAGAIDRLLRDPELARRLGAAARRRARERYSRAAMVQRFEELYTRLVHEETTPCSTS